MRPGDDKDEVDAKDKEVLMKNEDKILNEFERKAESMKNEDVPQLYLCKALAAPIVSTVLQTITIS